MLDAAASKGKKLYVPQELRQKIREMEEIMNCTSCEDVASVTGTVLRCEKYKKWKNRQAKDCQIKKGTDWVVMYSEAVKERMKEAVSDEEHKRSGIEGQEATLRNSALVGHTRALYVHNQIKALRDVLTSETESRCALEMTQYTEWDIMMGIEVVDYIHLSFGQFPQGAEEVSRERLVESYSYKFKLLLEQLIRKTGVLLDQDALSTPEVHRILTPSNMNSSDIEMASAQTVPAPLKTLIANEFMRRNTIRNAETSYFNQFLIHFYTTQDSCATPLQLVEQSNRSSLASDQQEAFEVLLYRCYRERETLLQFVKLQRAEASSRQFIAQLWLEGTRYTQNTADVFGLSTTETYERMFIMNTYLDSIRLLTSYGVSGKGLDVGAEEVVELEHQEARSRGNLKEGEKQLFELVVSHFRHFSLMPMQPMAGAFVADSSRSTPAHLLPFMVMLDHEAGRLGIILNEKRAWRSLCVQFDDYF